MTERNILVLGGAGQLGQCIQKVEQEFDLGTFFYADEVNGNILDSEVLEKLFHETQPQYVINCAAYTAVDKAEEETELCRAVNAEALEHITRFCKEYDSVLIQISTDFVFQGDTPALLNETMKAEPISVYGQTKLQGERVVEANMNKYFILRTSWLYSEFANNFVKTMVRLAKERDELSVVADQYGCPTYAGDLAHAILQICERHEQGKALAWGIYHYCGDTPTSWHGFARAIFIKAEALSVIAKRPQLTAISSNQYPTPAKRPEYSVMSTVSLNDIGVMPSDWIDGLVYVIEHLSDL